MLFYTGILFESIFFVQISHCTLTFFPLLVVAVTVVIVVVVVAAAVVIFSYSFFLFVSLINCSI